MSTLDKSTGNKISQLQSYIAGDRNMFVFLENSENSEIIKKNKVINFLVKLNKIGYGFDNAYTLFQYTKDDFKRFKSEFIELIDNSTKDGMILRKTFGSSEELTDYTSEEWIAILAQYSITYGWTDQYSNIFLNSAVDVLDKYVGSLSKEISDITESETKIMTICNRSDLELLIGNIVESPVVLRSQQIKTLESVPVEILANVCKDSKITIKETLIKVMSLMSSIHLDFPLLKTATDVLRYIVSVYAHDPLEGQLLKHDLKSVKLRIPSSARKMLLRNLELIAFNQNIRSDVPFSGPKYLTEDMFTYEMFWKRLDKYLRYEKAIKARAKFPNYTKAIDLLYDGDRSWTFNGRFSKAKSELNYNKAIKIAAERPGFLMRNLMEFLRMTKNVKLPVKIDSKVKSKPVRNSFQDALSGISKEKIDPVFDSVQKDASKYLKSEKFSELLNKNLNVKLAWQLLENLKDESNFKSVNSRVVQGITIKYSTPFPGLNRDLTELVRKQILKSIKFKLRNKNEKLGNVYIDDDSKKYRLQYSGRSSTEISFAGEFLSPGSELSISDIIKDKDIDDVCLRLGVMWRGLSNNQSFDIDHNVKVDHTHDVFYGNPVLKRNNDILISSSGDITSCGGPTSKFSTELIDIDLAKCAKHNIKELYNSLIMFSGGITLGETETYLFFSIIDKKNRKMRTNVEVDLSKTDYAIRIDPNNIDKTGSYIGVNFNFEEDKILVLCAPIKNSDNAYSNVKSNKPLFDNAIKQFDKHLSIGYALKKSIKSTQFVELLRANIIISRKSREELGISEDVLLIHPGREMEEINKIIM